MNELTVLRHAIRSLLNNGGDRQADAWLVSFQASARCWQLCLRLLNTPDCEQDELWFAANTLRNCFLRVQVRLLRGGGGGSDQFQIINNNKKQP